MIPSSSDDPSYVDPFAAPRARMVQEQLAARGIGDRAVLDALRRVPREKFVAVALVEQAYEDRALPNACGQTVSQPYIVALMTEALELTGAETVLEVGTGSGYQAAILSELAKSVITIERHPEWSVQAARRLASLGCQNVNVVVGDGTLGWPEEAPYDRIIVTAAARSIPRPLVDQLVDGGLLVMPIEDGAGQQLYQFRREGNHLKPRKLCDCAFVPLVSESSEPPPTAA